MNSLSEQQPLVTADIRAFEFPLLRDPDCDMASATAAAPLAQDSLQSEYQRGVRDGIARSDSRLRDTVESERQRVNELLTVFEKEKSRYFHEVEREVVRLACAIARKVLHRESQVDPQLLLRLVRSALQDVQGATRIRVYVNPADRKTWAETLSSEMGAAVEIVGEEGLSSLRSRIETDLGSAVVGWEEQLAEVERGLFDLLEKNPGRVQ
jgi:flagellar assembly protein FliH